MIPYDKSQEPPAPMLQVAVSKARRSLPRKTAPALLDMGADISTIPQTFLTRLGLYPVGQVQLEGVQANKVIVFSYSVRLKFSNFMIKNLEVVTTDHDFVVLGRDVPGSFYTLFNGPELTFDISQTSFISAP